MLSDDDRPLQSFARTALRGPRAIRSLSPHSKQIVAVFSGMCEDVSAHGLDFEPMGNFLAQKRGILGMDPAPSAVRRQETLHGVAKMRWSWSDSGLIPTVIQIAESLRTRTAATSIFFGRITAAAYFETEQVSPPPSRESSASIFSAWLRRTYGASTLVPSLLGVDPDHSRGRTLQSQLDEWSADPNIGATI